MKMRKARRLTAADFAWEHVGGPKWRTTSRTYCGDEDCLDLLAYTLHRRGKRYELRLDGGKVGAYKSPESASRAIADWENEARTALALEGGRS
jgi:hypothetical protein